MCRSETVIDVLTVYTVLIRPSSEPQSHIWAASWTWDTKLDLDDADFAMDRLVKMLSGLDVGRVGLVSKEWRKAIEMEVAAFRY